jgi:hypothetical protein
MVAGMIGETPRESSRTRRAAEESAAAPPAKSSFARRIDCSEPEEDAAEKRPRRPARSDGVRRENGSGGSGTPGRGQRR